MVIIDAGHGGADPGGGSNEYWLEKDFTLKISLYQYNRLRQLGVPVRLTRSSDITLPPDARVTKAFNLSDGNKDLLVSNHINIDFKTLDGAEVIYSIKDFNTFASIIASNLKIAGQNLSTNGIYTRTNQFGNDYYYIIRNTRPIESVIVEYGFADSTGDDINVLLYKWEALAEAVVKSICEYLGYPYKSDVKYDTYIVMKGDTLYSIAMKYNMNIETLKNINNLTSNTIYPGQKLNVYPEILKGQTVTYVVVRGDTLYNIAKTFGTTVEKIKKANSLGENTIYPQDVLIIPVEFEIRDYTVQKGDTLYGIASKYDTSVDLLVALNNLTKTTIYPNQSLLVPNRK